MPYIIKTKRPGRFDYDPAPLRIKSRRAVATLLDAREECVSIVAYADSLLPWRQDIDGLPESGGTIGPLPDGTVVEVQQVGWIKLHDLAEIPHGTRPSLVEIIDAYNAREKVA